MHPSLVSGWDDDPRKLPGDPGQNGAPTHFTRTFKLGARGFSVKHRA